MGSVLASICKTEEPQRPVSLVVLPPQEQPVVACLPEKKPLLETQTVLPPIIEIPKTMPKQKQKLDYCQKMTIRDFDYISVLPSNKTIGRGAFAKVDLVKKKDNQSLYAMKIVKKSEVEERKSSTYVLTERNILLMTNSPFIVHLRYAFQDDYYLYYCMDYVSGGDLSNMLGKKRRLTTEQACFIAGEVLLGLEYLHKDMHIIYRDLKPENILVEPSGHIKLTDFGVSRCTPLVMQSGSTKPRASAAVSAMSVPRSSRVAGCYVDQGHNFLVDYWSLVVKPLCRAASSIRCCRDVPRSSLPPTT